MLEKMQDVLNKIRPMLQKDGGDVEIICIDIIYFTGRFV